MKTLVVINGVTGGIGTACLARFSREHDTNILGLSRKAIPAESFCRDGRLTDCTLISSFGDVTSSEDCQSLADKIDRNLYEKIIYIHCIGHFPVELDGQGHISVVHDDDHDGIDDRVMRLSHDAFFSMASALGSTGLPVRGLIFGSTSDKFKPLVHKSWWTVMGKIKDRMKAESAQKGNLSFCVLNISSVIEPSEIITRPFVFRDTNADPKFWLMPHEVAERVVSLAFAKIPSFVEDEIFHKADYYDDDYFEEEKYTSRRRAELGLKQLVNS